MLGKLALSMLWESFLKDPKERTPLERAWDTGVEVCDGVELYNTVLSWSDTPAERERYESC